MVRGHHQPIRDAPTASPNEMGHHMPDQLPADQPTGRPTTQASHDAHAFNRFRGGLEEGSQQEVPRLPPAILYGAIIALVSAIGFSFAPWVRYELNDGTTITESGIRGDGLVMVLTALVSIGALAIAGRREPGDASFPAMIGFGFSVIGLLAVGYIMMDPGYIQVDTESQPVALTRGWGLIGGFFVMLAATWGVFRLWRIADHF